MGTVVVRVREVYGQLRAYPVNDSAKAFTILTGAKTLSPENIKVIKQLGFEVIIEPIEFPCG